MHTILKDIKYKQKIETWGVMSLKDMCTILHTYKTQFQPKTPQLQLETTQLKCYNNPINTLGQCTLPCWFQNKDHCLIFKVITENQQPLLSGTTCTVLGLITLNSICNVTACSSNLIKEQNDVFEDLGCLGKEWSLITGVYISFTS